MISLDFLILQILHSGSQIPDPRLAVNGEGGRGGGGSDPFTGVRERGSKKKQSLCCIYFMCVKICVKIWVTLAIFIPPFTDAREGV